jgi:hypothetical protein
MVVEKYFTEFLNLNLIVFKLVGGIVRNSYSNKFISQ